MNRDVVRYIPAAIGTPRRSTESIRALITKIGGSPVGLPASEWPQCKKCHRDMNFLVQLDLHTSGKVSQKFRFAYLFFCNGFSDWPKGTQCPSWDAQAGSNCVRLISNPLPAHGIEARGIVRYDEFSVDLRVRYEPVVDSEDFSFADELFLDSEGKEDIRSNTSCTIKIGGTPVFLQTPERIECPACAGPMQFIAQIGSELENPGWGGYSLDLAGGELFVFKCATECSAKGAAMYLQLD
jgi:hypothetical protein